MKTKIVVFAWKVKGIQNTFMLFLDLFSYAQTIAKDKYFLCVEHLLLIYMDIFGSSREGEDPIPESLPDLDNKLNDCLFEVMLKGN